MDKEEKVKKLKEIKREYLRWCAECSRSEYWYACSGYRSEKCLEKREEWLKEQLKNIRD